VPPRWPRCQAHAGADEGADSLQDAREAGELRLLTCGARSAPKAARPAKKAWATISLSPRKQSRNSHPQKPRCRFSIRVTVPLPGADHRMNPKCRALVAPDALDPHRAVEIDPGEDGVVRPTVAGLVDQGQIAPSQPRGPAVAGDGDEQRRAGVHPAGGRPVAADGALAHHRGRLVVAPPGAGLGIDVGDGGDCIAVEGEGRRLGGGGPAGAELDVNSQEVVHPGRG
jgi:hypothetical protein